MKMKKLNSKQVKFLISLISVAIFAYAYLNVYTKYVTMTTQALAETETIKQQIANRNTEMDNEETVEQDITKIQQQIDAILDRFPVYIAKEDNLMFLEQMETSLNINIPTMNMAEPTVFYTTEVPARKEQASGEDTEVTTVPDEFMTGLQSSISISFQTTYDGFKELTDYINQYPDKTVIENASLSYDSSTGELMGSMVLQRYALTGTGKPYEPPYIDDIDIGTDNIFGTSGE